MQNKLTWKFSGFGTIKISASVIYTRISKRNNSKCFQNTLTHPPTGEDKALIAFIRSWKGDHLAILMYRLVNMNLSHALGVHTQNVIQFYCILFSYYGIKLLTHFSTVFNVQKHQGCIQNFYTLPTEYTYVSCDACKPAIISLHSINRLETKCVYCAVRA